MNPYSGEKAMALPQNIINEQSNVKLPENWGGPDANQLMLTTFADISRAQEAYRVSRDAEIEYKTGRRAHFIDTLHQQGVLNDNQLKAAYEFFNMYARSLGQSGASDREKLERVDCDSDDPHEQILRLIGYGEQSGPVDRRLAFKKLMRPKSYQLMESFALAWLRDQPIDWQVAVKIIYYKRPNFDAAEFLCGSIENVITAIQLGA